MGLELLRLEHLAVLVVEQRGILLLQQQQETRQARHRAKVAMAALHQHLRLSMVLVGVVAQARLAAMVPALLAAMAGQELRHPFQDRLSHTPVEVVEQRMGLEQ
jgi:hypothetical protein